MEDRSYKFRDWLAANETHWITDPVSNPSSGIGKDGKKIMPMVNVINTVFSILLQNKYNEPDNPNQGTVILDANVISGNRTGNKLYPIRVVVYNPSVLNGRFYLGQANTGKGILRMYWDKNKQQGISSDGTPFSLRQLKHVIAHELTHMTDQGLYRQNRDVFKQFKNPEEKAAWMADTSLDPEEFKVAGSAKTDDQYKKYVNSPWERKAFRNGVAFELADRLRSGGSVDPNNQFDFKNTPEAEAMDKLRGVKPDHLVSSDRWQDMTSKKDLNRARSDAYRLLRQSYRGRENDQPVQQNKYGQMAAQKRAMAQQQAAQSAPVQRSWWQKLLRR